MKCLKQGCNGDLSDDMYTDGIEWEQYSCDECGALHEVPITRNDDGFDEVDIDRHWDDLVIIDEDEEDGECCKDYNNLEFESVGNCFGYNIYSCNKCGKRFDVPVEPNFDEMEEL